jgi:SAM-dependent methyltransferase
MGLEIDTLSTSHADVEDVRSYYRKILPCYEKEAIARAHLAFWQGLARRLAPGRILELGSGIGRITAALSRLAPTIGIDISFEMLGRAAGRPSAASRARFVAADMREAVFGCRFDLIVAPADPFSHLTTMRDRRRALRRVAGQLSPHGRFVLEGLCRRSGLKYPERRIEHPGGVLRVAEEWKPLGTRDLWRARYRYRESRAGEEDRTLEASLTARAWNPREVRTLFASCGLAVENLWGDFGRRSFRPGMRRLIIVARPKARFLHRKGKPG